MKEVEEASAWSEERELYQIFAKQTYDYSKSSFYDAKYDLGHWENEPNKIERKIILDEINRVRRKIQNWNQENGMYCVIETGKRAALQWLDRQEQYWSKPEKARIEIKNATKKRFANRQSRIEKTQDILLSKAYDEEKGLPKKSPLKSRINRLEFFSSYHDFDSSILAQIVADVEKSTTAPNNLIVMYQGVYREYLKNKNFGANKLIVSDAYRDIKVEKDTTNSRAYYSLNNHIAKYVFGDSPSFGDMAMVNKKRLEKYLHNKTTYAFPAYNRIKENIELYHEQETWIMDRGEQKDKDKWQEDKKYIITKLDEANEWDEYLHDIIVAFEFLSSKWLENKIPLIPSQVMIREWLLEQGKKQGESCWNKYHESKWETEGSENTGKWSHPFTKVRKYLHIPTKPRGKQALRTG